MTDTTLQAAIDIVKVHATPEQVFTPEQLIQWARDHVEPHDIYNLKALKATIDDLKAEAI